MSDDQASLPSPSLLRRLSAMFYDSWLVLALLILGGAILLVLKLIIAGAQPTGQIELSGWWRVPTFITMLAITSYFFIYFWVKNRQTLAMQTWRIQVVDDASGDNISWTQAHIRFLAAFLSAACFGLGYLWVLVDKQKKSWHDRLSGTRLILLPKPAKKK